MPIGILGTYLVWRNIPVTRPLGGQAFDFGGAATLCLGLLGILLGLTTGQQEGFTSPQALGLFVFGTFFLLALLYIQRRHPQPIIDPVLFRNRLFTVNLITGLLVFVGLGSGVLIPFYLETVLGYGVQQVGLLLAVVPIALGIVSPISGVLSDRVGSRPISVLGLLVTLLGYLALSTLSTETTAVGFMLRYVLVGVGIGLFQSPNNSAMMGTAPSERLGVASGLLAMTRNLGQTVGIAVLGALWTTLVFGAAGGPLAGGATAAPLAAQAAGLAGVSRIVAGLIGLALVVALWAWWGERGTRR